MKKTTKKVPPFFNNAFSHLVYVCVACNQTALAAAKARAAAVAAKYAGGHGSNSGGGSAGNTGSNNTPLGSGTLTGNGDSASDAAKRAQMIAERLGMNLPPSSKRAAPDRLENGPSKRKRVDIPEPDKPGINYSGLIIGPRGSTQKYLEQQSGCRILLRGQGTNQNPNYQVGADMVAKLLIGKLRTTNCLFAG